MTAHRGKVKREGDNAVKQHFVTFYSPGTFVAEMSEYSIDYWDVEKAKRMALKVKERYGAVPYGFRFSTRSRTEKDLDSKVSAESPLYYLGDELYGL